MIAGLTSREVRLVERCVVTMLANVREQLEREQSLQVRRTRARRHAPVAARRRR